MEQARGTGGRGARLVVAGLVLAVSAASLVVRLITATARLDTAQILGEALFAFGFAAVGALLIVRRPQAVVGRLCALAGVCFSAGLAAPSLARHQWLAADTGWVGPASAWLSTWVWVPAFVATFLILPVVFPDGRLPSRRWRPYLVMAIGVPALQAGARMLAPGPMVVDETTVWSNPIGTAAARPVLEIADAVLGAVFLPLLALMVVAVARRYRGGDALQRQQLRWFLTGVTVVMLTFVLSAIAGDRVPLLARVLAFAMVLLPTSIGVAVLRYRLYDLDRVVSRTVTYGLLTSLLVVCYLGGVLVLGGVLQRVGGSSDLAVATSTLLVAALFVPLRRRVQHLVDRRFNRARYDAEQTLTAFRRRLREETDLDEVTAGLIGAVHDTVEPAAASVWLRVDTGVWR